MADPTTVDRSLEFLLNYKEVTEDKLGRISVKSFRDQTMDSPTKSSEVKIFQPEEIIAREGSPSTDWYILLSGRVGVYKKDLKITEFTQKGMVFGELSVILNERRTATLKAVVRSEVLCISASLEELIKSQPDVTRKIIVNLAERLAKTTNDLSALSKTGKE
jgi:CRP-like cAMP-binding protein